MFPVDILVHYKEVSSLLSPEIPVCVSLDITGGDFGLVLSFWVKVALLWKPHFLSVANAGMLDNY